MVKEPKKRYTGRDLSDTSGSLAAVLKDVIPALGLYKTKQLIIDLCHEKVDPYVKHGISEQTANKFFQALEKSRGLYGAMQTVTNFCLAGCGLATY